MIFNTNISIAAKDSYGQYEIRELSIFNLEKVNANFPSFEIKPYKNKEVSFKVKCPLCGEYHHYNYSIVDFIKREMVMGGCETLRMPIFFIGNKLSIEKRINKQKETIRKAYAMIQ